MNSESKDWVSAVVISLFAFTAGAAFAFADPALIVVTIGLPGEVPVLVGVGLLTFIFGSFVALGLYRGTESFVTRPRLRAMISGLFVVPIVIICLLDRKSVV